MQQTIRLTKRVIEILSPYSDDAFKAINEMRVRIEYLESENSKLRAVADALQSKQVDTARHWTNTGPSLSDHDQKYWLKMSETIKEAIVELQRG